MSEKNLPTSDLTKFDYQLDNPNQSYPGTIKIKSNIEKVRKNLLISYVSDSTGCGHIRNIFPMTYLNAVAGKDGKVVPFIAPFFIYQHDFLIRCRSMFFQRTMSPSQIPQIKKFKDLQKRYKFKMVYDIDDFIWDGPNNGERIPDYNLASSKIDSQTKKSTIEIMNMMDTVCVSTKFLKDYLVNNAGVKSNVVVIPNAIPKYFWQGNGKRPLIKKKLEKPRVIYTGSPTHYCNARRLKGDWDSEWTDWVIKSVVDKKIEFCCMGGLPWFFEKIKNKILVINWLNSFQYHLPILKFKPDFGISPLVQNYFNYSKSDIKHIEYCAAGCVSIGTTFTNGMPSPYDNNLVKVNEKVTVEELDELILNKYSEPNLFNKTITDQYNMLDRDGRWLDSPRFINNFSKYF